MLLAPVNSFEGIIQKKKRSGRARRATTRERTLGLYLYTTEMESHDWEQDGLGFIGYVIVDVPIPASVKSKDIASYVTAYNKSKLVNLIFEQTMVPFHVLNQDVYQKAINVQAELMLHANSEKVRSDAAAHILTHLKPPETTKIELDVGVQKDSSIDALRAATLSLVAEQRDALKAGVVTAQDVAHQPVVIEGESEEVG